MGKPKIRFRGYTEDWEQRKLKTVATFSKGSGYSKGDLQEDGTPIILYGRLYTKYETIICEVDTFVSEKSGSVHSQGGEVIIPASGETAEDIARASTVENKGVLLGGDLNIVIPNEDIDSAFLALSISNGAAHRELASKAQGKSVVHIHNAEIQALNIAFPSKPEQSRISVYFSNLDHLITLHQRKCEETKKLKKYMLQKMFPRNGQKVPEIRFSGFTEDWEQRKLGDALISLQNNTLSRADLSNETGIAKNVHYGDVLIKFGEVLDVSKEKLPMISDESVLSKYKASFLQNGDVIVADTAEDLTVGKCSEIAGLNDEVVLSGLHTIPYRPIERFAAGYLGYYLNSSAYHNQLIPLMQGIKVTSISKSAMQDTDIVYPKSVEEQGKIGNYFQSLDNLITLHQRKCDELQNIKKYMLQNMFV